MSVEQGEVERILRHHRAFVSTRRERWKRHRSALETKFWEDTPMGERAAGANPGQTIRMEKNRMAVWLAGWQGGLFYKGFRTLVQADDLLEEGDKLPEGKPIEGALEWWLASEEAKAEMKAATDMALMYEYSALWGSHRGDAKHPMRAVRLDALPPWEIGWDRRVRKWEDHRYLGRLRRVSKEELRERATAKWKLPDELTTSQAPDVVANGDNQHAASPDHQDSAYVEVLELVDLVGSIDIEPEGAPAKKLKGRLLIYLLDQVVQPDEEKRGPLLVFEGPAPFTDAEGRPLVPLIPVVLSNVPEYPLEGIPQAAAVYELVKEENHVVTALAQAFRKDVGRKMAYDKNAGLDDDAVAKWTSGIDLVVIPVEGDPSKALKPIEHPPVTKSVLDYYSVISSSHQDVNPTSNVTRGQSERYITATQSLQLNDYTESQLGETKSRLDVVVVKACRMFLRILSVAMKLRKKDKFRLAAEGRDVTVEREEIERVWKITMVDIASTPVGEAQKRAEFQEVLGPLMEAAAVAMDETQPQASRALAMTVIDHLVELYSLPPSFRVEQIEAKAKSLPRPPEPEPAPEAAPLEPQPAQVPPEVLEAATSPATQGITDAVGVAQ